MHERWKLISVVAAVVGTVVATVSWLAVEPVEGCFLLMSLPPQGACQSRLGTITPLGPGASALGFAILTGLAACGLTWVVTLGSRWRRRVMVAAGVSAVIGVLTMPRTCAWVIPAGEMLHVEALVRACHNVVGGSTPTPHPHVAAGWSLTAAGMVLIAIWMLEAWRQRRQTRRSSTTP